MKKYLALILGAAWILAGFSTTVAAPANHTMKPNFRTKATKTSWLFTISSGQANIKKGKQPEEYVLRMNLPDINQVSMFTDRPKRKIKIISGLALKKSWQEGSNSFAANPPNAVLSAANLRPVFVTLLNTKVKGNHMIFQFKLLQAKKDTNLTPNLEHITLTIDAGTQETGETAAEFMAKGEIPAPSCPSGLASSYSFKCLNTPTQCLKGYTYCDGGCVSSTSFWTSMDKLTGGC